MKQLILFIMIFFTIQCKVLSQDAFFTSPAEEALPFSSNSEALSESWIKHRRDLNTENLRSLDPARLLHNFRVNALQQIKITKNHLTIHKKL